MTKRVLKPDWKRSEDYYKVRVVNVDGRVSTMSFDWVWLVPYLRAAGGRRAFNKLARECARGCAGETSGARSAAVRRLVEKRLIEMHK